MQKKEKERKRKKKNKKNNEKIKNEKRMKKKEKERKKKEKKKKREEKKKKKKRKKEKKKRKKKKKQTCLLMCISVMTPFSLRDSNQRTACARSVRVSPHVCCQVYKVQVSVSNIVTDARGSRVHTTSIHKYHRQSRAMSHVAQYRPNTFLFREKPPRLYGLLSPEPLHVQVPHSPRSNSVVHAEVCGTVREYFQLRLHSSLNQQLD